MTVEEYFATVLLFELSQLYKLVYSRLAVTCIPVSCLEETTSQLHSESVSSDVVGWRGPWSRPRVGWVGGHGAFLENNNL